MTPDEHYARGKAAAWLLEQETFSQALDSCRVYCQMEWAGSAEKTPEERERIFLQFTAIGAVENMLKNFVEIGNRAKEALNGD